MIKKYKLTALSLVAVISLAGCSENFDSTGPKFADKGADRQEFIESRDDSFEGGSGSSSIEGEKKAAPINSEKYNQLMDKIQSGALKSETKRNEVSKSVESFTLSEFDPDMPHIDMPEVPKLEKPEDWQNPKLPESEKPDEERKSFEELKDEIDKQYEHKLPDSLDEKDDSSESKDENKENNDENESSSSSESNESNSKAE